MVHRLKRTTRLTNLQLCTVLIRCIDLWLAAVRHGHVANAATTEALLTAHARMHALLLIERIIVHAYVYMHQRCAATTQARYVCRRPSLHTCCTHCRYI